MSEFRIFAFGFVSGFGIGSAFMPFDPSKEAVEALAYSLAFALLAAFSAVVLFGRSKP